MHTVTLNYLNPAVTSPCFSDSGCYSKVILIIFKLKVMKTLCKKWAIRKHVRMKRKYPISVKKRKKFIILVKQLIGSVIFEIKTIDNSTNNIFSCRRNQKDKQKIKNLLRKKKRSTIGNMEYI